MIRVLVLLLPLIIGFYALTINSSGGIALLTIGAIATIFAGATINRYHLLSLGGVLLLLSYWASLLASGNKPDFWGAIAVSISAFLIFELGYDWIVLFRRSPTFSEYVTRWRHLIRSCGLGCAGAYLFTLLAVNLVPRIQNIDKVTLYLIATASSAGISVTLAALIRLWLRRLRPPPNGPSDSFK